TSWSCVPPRALGNRTLGTTRTQSGWTTAPAPLPHNSGRIWPDSRLRGPVCCLIEPHFFLRFTESREESAKDWRWPSPAAPVLLACDASRLLGKLKEVPMSRLAIPGTPVAPLESGE